MSYVSENVTPKLLSDSVCIMDIMDDSDQNQVKNLSTGSALLSENINQHVCHRVQRSSGDFQGLECRQHFTLKFLVMDIELCLLLDE